MPDDGGLRFIEYSRKFGIKPGLERIERLLNALDRPHDKLKFVHIAGTNGKGSVASFMGASFALAGFRTGVFTSPYLERFSERIRVIDGREGFERYRADDRTGEISEEDIVRLAGEVEKASSGLVEEGDPPTEFEILTAMCFLYFAEKETDIAVLETGLGGRLDSTNIIEAPLCSVISSIGMDHEDRLGDTAAKIACEKAGIIKVG